MIIKRLELENIKSYEKACYEFDEGIIAIIGENGSGKTTIIEAIAWTLFDVLEYKKEDFVRRGRKRGIVRVSFISPTDGREYDIYRDTDGKYEVYDAENEVRIAQGKSEVIGFLKNALGVRNVDLQTLFKCAIGVPQGTFTSDFLRSASERKIVFDKLLRVEEYAQASKALLSTEQYGEQRKNEIAERIFRAEGEIKHLQTYEEEIGNVESKIKKLSDELEELTIKIKEKSELIERLNEQERKFVELKESLEKLGSEKQKNEHLLEQKKRELEEAERAVKKIEEVEKDYRRYLEVENALKELDQKRSLRSKLLERESKLKVEISKLTSELEKLGEDLKRIEEALARIEQLKLLLPKQEELEKKLQEAQSRIHLEKHYREQLKNLDRKIDALVKEYNQKSKHAQSLEKQLEDVEDYNLLNLRFNELTEQITYLQAKLEAEEKFAQGIKNGLCPILGQKCLNLREGETLEGFVVRETSDLLASIESLQAEKELVQSRLHVSREAEKNKIKLEELKSQLERIAQEGKSLREEQVKLKAELEELEKSTPGISGLREELENLGNPKAQIKLLKEEVKRKPELQKKISQTKNLVSQLSDEVEAIKSQINSLGDVEQKWQQLSREKDETKLAYEQYLRYKKTADLFPEIKQELNKIEENLKNLTDHLSGVEKEFENVCKTYNREQHENERLLLQAMKLEQTKKKADFENLEKELENYKKQIEKLREVRRQIQREYEEKQKLEKVLETIRFIRETLKASGPLIVKSMISQISSEASRIFQEIMDNTEVILEWTEDYSIVVEEKGYKRPFTNLSGGEQMAAALAVRLAFLLLLSDVRIAFFDEPTTNMDKTRCEKLAQQIERINSHRYFSQLFLISHDSTFESLVDTPVYVKKQSS